MPPQRTVIVGVALLAACQAPAPTSAPTPPVRTTTATAAPTPSSRPAWVVGASPLPLRKDGFGRLLPTPQVLRDRRITAPELLAPPPDGRFRATTSPVTTAIRARMGETYRPGCPVALSSLRYLTVTFHGFDGRAHTGELVVAARAAPSVVRVFKAVYDARFPIEEMRLPSTRDVRAAPTGDGNNTVGFVCRPVVGQRRFSEHAYGLAIDLNPFQNPYVRGDLVLPELSSAYLDRRWRRPGMLLRGSAAVRAFTREGWRWGGNFRTLKDYHHFSLTGR